MNNKGPGWILCPSKKHPGFFYYFNVLSGETVWSLHCLPKANPPDGTPSNFEGNVVRSRNTKDVEFGKAEFQKYINIPNHKQKKDGMPTDLWNGRVIQEMDDNFSSYSIAAESFGNVQVLKHKNKSTQSNLIPSQSWWNIEADLKSLNCARDNARTSKPFQLKSPKIKRFTNHYNPIKSPILKSNGFSCRNTEMGQKQEIRSRDSKQIFHENVESLNADNLRWKIMKRQQKSVGTETSQMQTNDEQQSVVTPNKKVKFFIDLTDEESLKLNGDILNHDAGTLPSHLVLRNQNCGTPTIVQRGSKENLFLQNTLDPLALSKSLQTNDLIPLRTKSFPNSNPLNEGCDDMKTLNLSQHLYMNHHTYSYVEAQLSTLCIKYEYLHVHVTARIEEWICCYLQIMEQFLHEMFQVTKLSKFEPPCWFIQGLKRLKEVFSYYQPVCAITDLLLSTCGYCVKNGIVRTNVKPNQFIKLLCGGILLTEEFMNYTQDVDVLGYKDMLQQLIESIRNPNIIHDMQAIDVAYLGEIIYDIQQPQDGESNASQTFGVSQKQPIKNKYFTNMNDPDCILEVSDDLSNDRYKTGFDYTNHIESVMNNNTSKVNIDWQITDNREDRININDENGSFYINAHENRIDRNIYAPHLTRTANVLTGDCDNVNEWLSGEINNVIASGRRDNLNCVKRISNGVIQGNDRGINDNEANRVSDDGNYGGINKVIASDRRDNLNYYKRNSYGVIQGNDRGINDNDVNSVSDDRNVIREKTVDVEIYTIDESNVVDVIQTMVKTMRRALEALKVHCENCYNELVNGDLTDGRKKCLRKATDEALLQVSAMLLELKGITKRDESNSSPIQRILGDQGQAYRIYIENCRTQTVIMENTLKYVIKVIDED